MKVIIAEDEIESTITFCNQMRKLIATCDIQICDSDEDVLDRVRQEDGIVVFLDVNFRKNWGGIDLAAKIHLINIDTSIVFIADTTRYAYYAFQMEAIGYLVRPYSTYELGKQLERHDRMRSIRTKNRVYIQTFGGFEISVDDVPLRFARSKAKEMLALLVDKRGASMTAPQVIAYLWEDREEDEAVKDYYKKVVQCLKRVLRQAGVEEILIDTGRGKALDTRKVRCDYFDLLHGKNQASQMYMNDYMPSYSWAEETNGILYRNCSNGNGKESRWL